MPNDWLGRLFMAGLAGSHLLWVALLGGNGGRGKFSNKPVFPLHNGGRKGRD